MDRCFGVEAYICELDFVGCEPCSDNNLPLNALGNTYRMMRVSNMFP